VFCELSPLQKNPLKVEKSKKEDEIHLPSLHTQKQHKLEADFGEELKCCICLDLIYQCYSTLPCLHNFCGSCLSGWLDARKTCCPQCRVEITELKKNNTINNLIHKILECKPELKKSKDDYLEMEKRNKLKEDTILISEYAQKYQTEADLTIDLDEAFFEHFAFEPMIPTNITRLVQISSYLPHDISSMYSNMNTLIHSMQQTLANILF